MKNGDVAMVSIWNKSGDITSGLHTFTVQKVNGEFVVYNRYNSVTQKSEYRTMNEVIDVGQLLTGYILQTK